MSSGFRSPELCKAIGSSSTSQHTRGEAADFEIFSIANKALAEFIVANLDFGQCILEFWNENEPNSGWVHCSYSSKYNRRQYLKAGFTSGIHIKGAQSLPRQELIALIESLTEQMRLAAAELSFELAARLRDEIRELKRELKGMQEAGS